MNYFPISTLSSPEINDDCDYDDYNLTKDDNGFHYLLVESVVMFYVTITISLFGIVGNVMVLWYLVFQIRRSPFSVYILNLAIADFTFLLILSTALLFLLLDFHGLLSEDYSHAYMGFFIMCGYVTSQYLLTAISVERCLSILFPIWYRCQRPKHQSAIVCAVLWFLSSVTSATKLFSCPTNQGCNVFSIIQAVIDYLIFLTLMILSNVTLVIKIWRSSRRHHPPRLYVPIITTVLFFLLLSVPLLLIIFLAEFSIIDLEYIHIYIDTAILFSSINSSINPVIYFLVGSLRRRRIRSSVTVALQRAFLEEEYVPPQQ